MKASVIGGGSWGSAFALHLGRLGRETCLWIREKDIFEGIVKSGENSAFLPGYTFSESVAFTRSLKEAVRGSQIVFVAVPSKFCRRVYERMAPYLADRQIVVSLTKGIEESSLSRMSEVMREVFQSYARPLLAALSGPSFALEVAQAHPTAVVVASESPGAAQEVQHYISNTAFRSYTSSDLTGVELSGAVKNVIAIAAGISVGLRFGYNSQAALITRGIAEMSRLGLKMGARRETFSGLAGVGDLILTCTGELSRNRTVGCELGRGKSLPDIISGQRMIAEGITTTRSVRRLSEKHRVEMPICEQVYSVLYKGKSPLQALQNLMSRKLKQEYMIEGET